jgi:DNA-3-methyladenine glycosylase I
MTGKSRKAGALVAAEGDMIQDHKPRCTWPGEDPRMLEYHDREWGQPVHGDHVWFEYLVLDAFQAGLSWRTVLYKRPAFRKVFHDFDPARVTLMGEEEIQSALANPGIIRNRLKIRAAVANAGAFLRLQERYGSFDAFIWSFTERKVIHNGWGDLGELPASTPLSDAISHDLKSAGFSFVGSTICYAFLQSGGVVNDHLRQCFRYRELGGT